MENHTCRNWGCCHSRSLSYPRLRRREPTVCIGLHGRIYCLVLQICRQRYCWNLGSRLFACLLWLFGNPSLCALPVFIRLIVNIRVDECHGIAMMAIVVCSRTYTRSLRFDISCPLRSGVMDNAATRIITGSPTVYTFVEGALKVPKRKEQRGQLEL